MRCCRGEKSDDRQTEGDCSWLCFWVTSLERDVRGTVKDGVPGAPEETNVPDESMDRQR